MAVARNAVALIPLLAAKAAVIVVVVCGLLTNHMQQANTGPTKPAEVLH